MAEAPLVVSQLLSLTTPHTSEKGVFWPANLTVSFCSAGSLSGSLGLSRSSNSCLPLLASSCLFSCHSLLTSTCWHNVPCPSAHQESLPFHHLALLLSLINTLFQNSALDSLVGEGWAGSLALCSPSTLCVPWLCLLHGIDLFTHLSLDHNVSFQLFHFFQLINIFKPVPSIILGTWYMLNKRWVSKSRKGQMWCGSRPRQNYMVPPEHYCWASRLTI